MNHFKKAIVAIALLPFAAMAQSVGESPTKEATISISELSSFTDEDKAYYEDFMQDLQDTAAQINEISEVWDKETAKRGYPKKKTVKEKASLVDQYISLLNTQLTDSRLNRFIDKEKVQEELVSWQNYRESLEKLM